MLRKAEEKVGKRVAKFAGQKAAAAIFKRGASFSSRRLIPGAGWVLFAKDIYDNRKEIKEFTDGVRASNESNRTRADGSWNSEWTASTCFIKGTMVYAREAKIAIENIKVGDIVYSYNIEKDKVELNKVVSTLFRETQGIYEITAGKETVNVTAEHPFYVVEKGWVKVKDLQTGDILKSSDSKTTIKISSIKIISEAVTVYNIEVDGNHNYFVTSSTILVHNKNITEAKKTAIRNTKTKN